MNAKLCVAMKKVKHEVWINNEGLTTLCFADERGNDCRRLLLEEEGSKIINVIYAESHFEAMTLYYKFIGFGEYNTDFEIYKIPYDQINNE